jgi:2-hydroxy-4-carboxymuconate semialdehyde hemiacetal dehydrogenase
MNIALLGCGAIAAEHVAALRAIGTLADGEPVDVASVFAPRPGAAEAFARRHGVPRFTTEADRILQDPQIEAVIVCSPSALHAPQTRAALSAGKHVLCEIPLVLALEDAMSLRDLAHQRHRVLMVAHTLRFDPALRSLWQQIQDSGTRPVAIAGRYHLLRRENTGWTGRKRSWTDNLLWHHGGHAVDVMVWLLGGEEVTTVGLSSRSQETQDMRLDAGLVMRTDQGAIGTVSLSYSSAIAAHDYTVMFEHTTFRAGPGFLLDGQGAPLITAEAEPSALVAQDLAFVRALRGQPADLVDVDAILPSLRALQTLADSDGWQPSTEERLLATQEAVLLDSAISL